MRTIGAAVALAVAATAAAAGAEDGKPPRRPPRLTLSTVGYTDTAGVYQVDPHLVAVLPVGSGAELRFGTGYTVAGLQLEPPPGGAGAPAGGGKVRVTVPGRSMLGAALSVPWSVLRGTVGYAAYVDSDSTLHDVELAAGVRAGSVLDVSGGVRRRPFVAMAQPLATDDQSFFSAGPGGASDVVSAWTLTVDEVRAVASVTPARWAYAYAEWRGMDVSDGNRGWTASGGAGLILTRLLGLGGPAEVVAKWDLWSASYRERSAVYYAPASVRTHSPGADLRLRWAAFEVAGGGGVTFVPGKDFTGVFGGGAAILRLGRFSIAARAEARKDPWFASRKGWLALQSDL
jgi:hypothetical protein